MRGLKFQKSFYQYIFILSFFVLTRSIYSIKGTIDSDETDSQFKLHLKELTTVKDKPGSLITIFQRHASPSQVQNKLYGNQILSLESIEDHRQRLSYCYVPIAITDLKTGELVDFNEHFEKWTGYRKNEKIGEKTTEFDFYIDPGDRKFIVNELTSNGKIVNHEFWIYNRNRGKTFALFKTDLIVWSGKKMIASAGIDITEKKEIETKLKESENKFRNLFNNATDAIFLWKLGESRNGIRTLALIHEELYQSNNFDRIDLEEYTNNLVSVLKESYVLSNDKIRFVVNAYKLKPKIDRAIFCGLILNELIANSLNHAFKNTSRGNITVELDERENNYFLSVSIKGKEMQTDTNVGESKSWGLCIVDNLVDQLNGKISIIEYKGTTYIMEFPIPSRT